MGIKDLNKLLESVPECILSLPIHSLSGRRIAIDTAAWIRTYLWHPVKKILEMTDVVVEDPSSLEIRKCLIKEAISFACRFIEGGCTPVFVFEGTAPVEKGEEKQKRADKAAAIRREIADKREVLSKSSVLEPDMTVVAELRKQMGQCNYIRKYDIDLLKGVLTSMGIPCLQALSEAERLCTTLCREKYVAAVFSTDTDCYVHGCPLLVTGLKGTYMDAVYLPIALERLHLSRKQFIDLAIIAGCDYNKKLPGPRIKDHKGIFGLYKLIQDHGSIEGIAASGKDVSMCSHIVCRKMFATVGSSSLYQKGDEKVNLSINKAALIVTDGTAGLLFELLDSIGLTGYIGKIVEYIEVSFPSSNGWIDSGYLPALQQREIKSTI